MERSEEWGVSERAIWRWGWGCEGRGCGGVRRDRVGREGGFGGRGEREILGGIRIFGMDGSDRTCALGGLALPAARVGGARDGGIVWRLTKRTG